MIFLTHLMFALLLGVIFLKIIPLSVQPIAFMGLLLFSSLIPDIDRGTTFLGKYLKPINFFLTHRTFFHSILFMVIAIIIMHYFAVPFEFILAFMIGFISHILLDCLTPMGVYVFWPSKVLVRGRLKTGGLFDMLLFIIFTVLVFGLLYFYGITEIGSIMVS